jgi:hypothetical protein
LFLQGRSSKNLVQQKNARKWRKIKGFEKCWPYKIVPSAAITNEQHKFKLTDRHSAAQKPNKRRYDALCGVFFVAKN